MSFLSTPCCLWQTSWTRDFFVAVVLLGTWEIEGGRLFMDSEGHFADSGRTMWKQYLRSSSEENLHMQWHLFTFMQCWTSVLWLQKGHTRQTAGIFAGFVPNAIKIATLCRQYIAADIPGWRSLCPSQ